jgi:sigma-B regulation protein RsbU (phosphoserine phosphatase)
MAGLLVALFALAAQVLFELPYFGMTLRGNRVVRVDPGGPAGDAGIESGDRILAVNGDAIDRIPFLSERFYSGALGRVPALDLESRYGVKSVHVVAEAKPRRERMHAAAAMLTGVGFVVIGVYTALRLEGMLTTLFFLLCAGFSLMLLPISPPEPPIMPWLVGSLRALAALFVPPLLLHFFLLFPAPRKLILQQPQILRWIYVPALVSLLPLAYMTSGALWQAPAVGTLWIAIVMLSTLSFGTFALLAILSFVRGYRRVRSGFERRRYSVTLFGTILGMAPILASTIVHLFRPQAEPPWEFLTFIGPILIPLSFAYAIVRHHLFDIEVFVKRSAAFSILTACLVAITIGVYAVFGKVLESLTGHRSTWAMIASLVFIALVFSPLRRRIERFVDRTFYRDRYDDRRMLRELSQSLPTVLRLEDLIAEVVEKLSKTLRARESVIYLASEGSVEYTLVYASGMSPEDLDLPTFPPRLAKILRRAGRPLRGAEIEEQLPYGPRPEDEERLLTLVRGGVMVPFGSPDRLLAVLLLSRRFGGESYGSEDLDLLSAIAGQATVAMRNALMYRKRVEEERIQRELAIARNLQEQFLPSESPVYEHMDIAGGTIPCTEVGGDFFDYLRLPGGRLGMVVGDVSGHGIPAALIMASMGATLRAEAERYPEPGALLTHLNARACATLEPGQFVSLFYGVVDPRSMRITYANAGHPAPLLIQSNGKVLRLTTGGLLLGIERTTYYDTDTVDCEAGATLLLFSDGLTEVRRGELVFGEDRVIDLVRNNGARSAHALRARIVQEARRFTGGELEDDLTLIVVRVR